MDSAAVAAPITLTRGVQPRWHVPALRQLALLLHSGRVWLLLGACLLPVFVIETMRRGGSAAGAVPALLQVATWFRYIAPGWAFVVWRGEQWSGRDYHWSLPVSQAEHDLWRVAAGAVWLLAGSALCCILGVLLALHAGQHEVLDFGALFYTNLVAYPLMFYLMASLFPVALRRPLGSAVGVLLVAALAGLATQVVGLDIANAVLWTRFGLGTAMTSGFVVEWISVPGGPPIVVSSYSIGWMQWLLTAALWIGGPALLIVAALQRRA